MDLLSPTDRKQNKQLLLEHRSVTKRSSHNYLTNREAYEEACFVNKDRRLSDLYLELPRLEADLIGFLSTCLLCNGTLPHLIYNMRLDSLVSRLCVQV